MSESQNLTKETLLPEIERTWRALHDGLARLTETQMTTLTDAEGWTVKDHLVHLAMWERSGVYFLQGKPRHEGLGVDEASYLNETDELEINALIQLQHKDLPLQDTLTLFQDVHQDLLALLQPLTDADLFQPYRHFLPNEPGDGDGPPAINVIYGNTANHFTEHLGWIESLANNE